MAWEILFPAFLYDINDHSGSRSSGRVVSPKRKSLFNFSAAVSLLEAVVEETEDMPDTPELSNGRLSDLLLHRYQTAHACFIYQLHNKF